MIAVARKGDQSVAQANGPSRAYGAVLRSALYPGVFAVDDGVGTTTRRQGPMTTDIIARRSRTLKSSWSYVNTGDRFDVCGGDLARSCAFSILALGISESNLNRWLRVAEREDQLAAAVPDSAAGSAGRDLEAENRELRKRTARLEQEVARNFDVRLCDEGAATAPRGCQDRLLTAHHRVLARCETADLIRRRALAGDARGLGRSG